MGELEGISAVYRRQGRTPLEDIHHTHDKHYELIQTWGQGSVLIGNEIFQMCDGRVFIIPPLCVHMTNPAPEDYTEGHERVYVRNIVKIRLDTLRKLIDVSGGLDELPDINICRCLNLSGTKAETVDRLIKSIAEAEGNCANIRRLTRLLELVLELFEDYCAPESSEPHDFRTGARIYQAELPRQADARYDIGRCQCQQVPSLPCIQAGHTHDNHRIHNTVPARGGQETAD